MEPPAYEPTGWVGILPWLMYFAPLAAPTALVAWGQWKAKKRGRDQDAARDDLKKTVGTIRDNVQNGHQTPMRDDLDKMIKGIKELSEEQKRQGAEQEKQGAAVQRIDRRVILLDENLSTEREERIAGDKR